MRRVVLCRPQGPRNVGSVLRLVANFGPAELVLVRPEKRSLLVHPDLEQMSHGVEDVLAKIRIVDRLEDALLDVTTSYGFTARARDHRRLGDWRGVREELVARAQDPEETVALVFGPEESGLSGAETDPLHHLVRMPTSDEHGSINLSMAVGICLSTVFFDRAPSACAPSSSPAPGADRAFLAARLSEVLGERTTSPEARRDLTASIDRIFVRSPLETRDARAWHLLAQALGGKRRPGDYGLPEGAERRAALNTGEGET
jgi:TrmH family RNA methyltransferase